MWHLILFAVIGLFIGAAARLWYDEHGLRNVLGSLLLGMVGALTGGVISWNYWPAVDDQFQTGNLVMSILGAMIAIIFWAGVAYARRIRA
jgi:uncharacterized membrane protein YeaQ/YmgE (transglycosylase-associated protein family)